ncbi:hypothetical protein [Sinomonas flava]|uniref:Uncharacterized protein n=1 Tax=Sinomonas flava TaxID=496857 RepID=A0ABP5NJR3_9MICC
MSTTPSGLPLATRLARAGVPDSLAAVLAETCTMAGAERRGEASRCVLDQAGARPVVEWLEGQLEAEPGPREAVVAMLGAAAVLFGAEEAGRLVLRHVPEAAEVLGEMAQEAEDEAIEDPLLATAAKAEPMMMRAALEHAAASDPEYNHELYMDESVLLPGFLLLDQGDADPVELNGALVSTPRGFAFVLTDGMLSPATAALLPAGVAEKGAVLFALDALEGAVFLVPDSFGLLGTDRADGADPEDGTDGEDSLPLDIGPSPDGDLYAHFELPRGETVSLCLAYSQWPAGKQEVLRRRFETVVQRVADALRRSA